MISLRYDGVEIALEALNSLADAPRTELMDEIGAYGELSTRERFEDGKGPDGTAWKPSARATQAGGQTLVDRARLLSSLTHNASAKGVEWGTNVVYAGIHQFGGKIKAKTAKGLAFRVGGKFVRVKSVTMPARPYLGVSTADAGEIEAIVSDWMARRAA